MCSGHADSAQREEQEVLTPLPRPMVWARYAAIGYAVEAMEDHRFGYRDWSVEHRPGLEPYPWCLMDNGEEKDE